MTVLLSVAVTSLLLTAAPTLADGSNGDLGLRIDLSLETGADAPHETARDHGAGEHGDRGGGDDDQAKDRAPSGAGGDVRRFW